MDIIENIENNKVISSTEKHKVIGYWIPDKGSLYNDKKVIGDLLNQVNGDFYVVLKDSSLFFTDKGRGFVGYNPEDSKALPIVGFVSSCSIKNLGDPKFCKDLNIDFPYIGGSMAHGISSFKMVEELAKEGMLGFFGSAGLSISKVEEVIERLKESLKDKTFGVNLIHSPNEPKLEDSMVSLLINKDINLIEASAYLDINLPLVRYRLKGIYRDAKGRVITPNRIIAKVSRIEVASKFFSPPPEKLVKKLVKEGEITPRQALMALEIPMAQDITAEADSGGHTDNRPTLTMMQTMLALKDRMQEKYKYVDSLRVGAAGGISTPLSAYAAFSMGASYVVTGSVNQACVESGTSEAVRKLLSQTSQGDTIMAPAADMFEMGVKVQVIKRGTMFPMRAEKLAKLYQKYDKIEDIPPSEMKILEKNYFKTSIEEIWNQTYEYFNLRDNTQLAMADKNPKYKMALIFRWYLGQASHWAIAGKSSRKMDYQIWCGPSMGAFNEWTKDTFFEDISQRKIITVAYNIIHGAMVCQRLNSLKTQGIQISPEFNPKPINIEKIREYLK